MTPNLIAQRCFLHGSREAVCRCPSCMRTYCRECVVEHDDRLLCAECIRMLPAATASKGRVRPWIMRTMAACMGVLCTWLVFYLTGIGLAAIPAEVHDGSVFERR